MTDAIDDYLDRLADRVLPGGASFRRVVAEYEAHLRESAYTLNRGGLDERAAAQVAIDRFGSVETVAAALRPSPMRVARQAARMLWMLAGIGMVAVGASGLLAWLLRATTGARFVAGDSVGSTYTPARCADFLEYYPRAGSCATAAALHHADEVVATRLFAGMVGVVILAFYAWYRRGHRGDEVALPAAAAPMVAAVLFGVAAGLLLLDSLALTAGELANGEATAGIGDPLSAGVVALGAALLAMVATLRGISGGIPLGLRGISSSASH